MDASPVPSPARTHYVSILQQVAADKPLVCKCKTPHVVSECPKLSADRDWGAIASARSVTEEWLAGVIASPPAVAPNLISKENLFAWAPARFDERRSNENALDRSVLGLDFDHVADREAFLVHLRSLGLRAYVHSSFTVRNADGTWRIRVYAFLDRPATPAEWLSVAAWVRATFPEIDAGTLDIARLLFFPVGVPGYWYELIEGAALRLDDVVAFHSVPADKPSGARERTTPVQTGDEVEPEHLRVVPQEKRESDAAAYIARIPKEGTGDGSGQLVRLAAVVVRGFGCGVEPGVRIIGEAPIGDAWSDVEIRRRCVDTMRARKRELGSKYEDPHAALRAQLAEDGIISIPAGVKPAMAERPTVAVTENVLPTFPVDVLPPVLRAFALAEAEATQTPVDMAAMLVLGCCSAAIAGKVEIEVDRGYVEPLNLFIVVGMPPGERKSAVFSSVFAPLRAVEREKADSSAPLISAAKTARDLLADQIKRSKGELAKLKPEQQMSEWVPNQHGTLPQGGAALRRQIGEMDARLRKLDVPAEPQLLCDDVTMERLAGLMAEQGGRMCIAAAEGTLFGIISGRYSRNGQSSFEVLLKGHAGDSLRVDRQSKDRPPVHIERACLTLALAVQPSVIRGLSSDAAMRGQGLLARFLYSIPVSKVGSRKIDAVPVPDAVRAAYEAVVMKLARAQTPEETAVLGRQVADGVDLFAAPAAIPRVKLSAEARALHRAFRAEVEPRLDPKAGDLADLDGWGSKWPGAVARIAGVLHCVENGTGGEVDASTMVVAIEIGKYLHAHAAAAFGTMAEAPEESDGQAILEWLKRTGAASFTMTEVARGMSPRSLARNKQRRGAAVADLVERELIVPAGKGWRLVG